MKEEVIDKINDIGLCLNCFNIIDKYCKLLLIKRDNKKMTLEEELKEIDKMGY